MDPVLFVQLVEPPLYVITTILLVWLSLPRANPLAAAFRPVWRTLTRRNYAVFVAIGCSMIVIDVILTSLDHHFTAAIVKWRGEDFTSLIWQIEGDFVKHFQRWTWPGLTWYMAWAYIVVFPVTVPSAMVVFDYLGEARKNVSLLIAYFINYILVLPFYFLFPVRECHEFRPGGEPFLRLVLDDAHPAIMKGLRPMSGIDNCFPSFHTSLVVTVALFAWFSGRRAFGIVMSLMALSVILATLYLGIHWIVDLGAGIVVGIIAYWLGDWLGKKYWARRVSRGRSLN